MIDACDSVILQFFDLRRKDGSSASSENFDMSRSFFFEQVIHVFEIFGMSALVTRHCNGLCIFFDGAIHHFFHASVVSEMDHFGPGALDYSTHDIDGGIVSVEKGSGRYDTDFILGLIRLNWLHNEIK